MRKEMRDLSAEPEGTAVRAVRARVLVRWARRTRVCCDASYTRVICTGATSCSSVFSCGSQEFMDMRAVAWWNERNSLVSCTYLQLYYYKWGGA